jgi:hypothetical protein
MSGDVAGFDNIQSAFDKTEIASLRRSVFGGSSDQTIGAARAVIRNSLANKPRRNQRNVFQARGGIRCDALSICATP